SPGDPSRSRIASPANPRVRAAAALRERRERDRTGRIVIDGAREVLRALDAGVAIETLFVCPERCRSTGCAEVLGRLDPGDARLVEVTETALAKLAFGARADGIVAVGIRPPLDLAAVRLGADPLVAVVEGVEKPGNLGAILRSADGAGVDALVAADPRTDLFNPNAIRASLGTIFAVPLAAGPSHAVRAWLADLGLAIVVARVDADRAYTEVDLTGPLAIVLGSEAAGLGPTWSGPDVVGVRLPMRGVADSLNVSAAGAVLLYEARRQREAGPAR
ncbi:MAG TPA: RNA methyltransferase, partial [Patescibacteria group bacterium]|nr:RNA methyltransferase [Patescibacteria group bacterium]